MMPGKDIQQLIDEYLKGSLNPVDKDLLESELVSNPVAKKQLEVTKAANNAILMHRLANVQDLLQNRIEKGNPPSPWNRVLFGLTILAIIGTSYYFFPTIDKKQELTPMRTMEPTVVPIQKETENPKIVKPERKKKQSTPQLKSLPSSSAFPTDPEVPKPATSDPIIPIDPLASTAPHINKAEAPSTMPQTQASANKAAVLEDHCTKTKLEAYVHPQHACHGATNGSIQITNLRGGQAPYQVKILDTQQQPHQASSLPAGSYTVVLTDGKHCQTTIANVVIKEEYCLKDFELNPHSGEDLDLGSTSYPATLTVYDQGENVYFYKQFNAGENIQWNGISNKGESLPGYFLFVIRYGNHKTREGSITIVN